MQERHISFLKYGKGSEYEYKYKYIYFLKDVKMFRTVHNYF